MKVEFSNTCRTYGYVIWPKRLDSEAEIFFGDTEQVELIHDDECLGIKRIDWVHRRVSIGYRHTRQVSPKAKYIFLEKTASGGVLIRFA